MNLNKLTQRSLEALQSAQSLAIQHNHQQVDQEHLLLALLQQENSLLMQLLRRMGRDEGVISSLEQALQKLHARGPMGLTALTTTKFIIYGNGQIR